MKNTYTVALLFGGQSAEHEVSIRSAINVRQALKAARFNVLLIGIDRQGVWRLAPKVSEPQPDWPQLTMLPGGGGKMIVFDAPTNTHRSSHRYLHADMVFPVLHGPLGEDGTVQGLLRLCQVPFVGSDVLASALCMDKEVAKRLLKAAGLPVVPSCTFGVRKVMSFDAVQERLGVPFFVKPANMGSSIGVAKVCDQSQYAAALEQAFRHDTKVLVERCINGREIECGILSGDEARASLPGEITAHVSEGFYSYDAKYLDDQGATLLAPANLPVPLTRKIQRLALCASRTLGCEGLVRVDFFLTPEGELFINELNAMPGFTDISMYPKLWSVSGVPAFELMIHLVNHAQQRHEQAVKRAITPAGTAMVEPITQPEPQAHSNQDAARLEVS